MNLKVSRRRYAKTSRDHTGTIPGTEEARGVAAYARVASADLGRRAIGFILPTRGASQPLLYAPFHPRSLSRPLLFAPFRLHSLPRLYTRNGDVTALLPSDNYKRCDHQRPSGLRI